MKKILATICLTLSIALSLAAIFTFPKLTPPVAHAYQIDPSFRPNNVPFALENEIKTRGSAGATVLILQILAGALLYFAAPIATIMIVFGGLQMVAQSNEPEKIEQAKKHLIWSAVGLILIVLSYSLVRIILAFALDAGTPSPT